MWLETWLTHQHRDDYWKHGSVCEDYRAIEVPVFAVSGWADGYSNAVFRMLAGLDVPRRGLVGPWSHKYPHLGVPGPAIGFLQECVRWWDRWLKGIDNGVDDEPMLLAWMQDSVAPALELTTRPGRWIAERSWPSPGVEDHVMGLGDAGLIASVPQTTGIAPDEPPQPAAADVVVQGADAPRLRSIASLLSVGMYAGKWASFTATPELPSDQRDEDGGSLNFDSLPLEAPMEILGAPHVELALTSDQPVAMLAVRLSDRLPDDRTTRVTYGLLNLCHRDSREAPTPLVPGETYRVQVQLNEVAHRFPRGHRLRLQISTSYWPVAWPAPHPVRLTIEPAESRLVLPVRPPRPDDADAASARFGPPEAAEPPRKTILQRRDYGWTVTRDLISREAFLETRKDEGTYRLDDINLEVHSSTTERYCHRGEDPTTVRVRSTPSGASRVASGRCVPGPAPC